MGYPPNQSQAREVKIIADGVTPIVKNAVLQKVILLYLDLHNADNVSAMADELHAPRSSVSRAVSELLKRGFVQKSRRLVVITESGRFAVSPIKEELNRQPRQKINHPNLRQRFQLFKESPMDRELQALFTVNDVLIRLHKGEATAQVVKLNPVYAASPNNPNHAFWKATPTGSIEMQINNFNAFSFFEQGKKYLVTFTVVDEDVQS